jgi:hypothetical protein
VYAAIFAENAVFEPIQTSTEFAGNHVQSAKFLQMHQQLSASNPCRKRRFELFRFDQLLSGHEELEYRDEEGK